MRDYGDFIQGSLHTVLTVLHTVLTVLHTVLTVKGIFFQKIRQLNLKFS